MAGSRRLWWGGAVLAAFLAACALLRRGQDRGFGPDSAARGFRSCSSWIRW